ncbi:MAG: T9SS type A sorting domain-containing protein [bacterium]|nr:T9SS type A sorting domain-containing protein [bacterium]
MRKFLLVVAGLFIFAKLSFAEWTISIIDSVGDVGKYASLHSEWYFASASYYDETNGNLKFINDMSRMSNSAPMVVDSIGDVGKFTSIYLWENSSDSSEFKNISISYYDETNGNLKYAWSKGTRFEDDTVFELFTVDSIGDVGLFTSIYVDTSYKIPYISYYDATNGDLKLAYFKDSVWNVQKIDTAEDVGKYNSISGYLDTVYISYYDSTNGDLKLAKYNGTNWQIEKVDTTGDVGKHSSINYFHFYYRTIDYYDVTNGNLKHAQRSFDTTWNITTIDSTEDVGMFCNSKQGVLTYYDKTNGNLKCPWGWGFIVDSSGDVGGYSSSIEAPELCLVIYYDFTNGNLKRACEGGAIEEHTNALNNTSLTITPNLSTKNFSISYALPSTSFVNLKVFNISGKVVDILSNEKQNAGKHRLFWQPNNLPNGLYFLQLNANETKLTKKLILMK